MKLKNHSFFKEYRTIKYVLLFHLAVSLFIVTSELVRAYKDGEVIKGIEKPLKNYKALYNPEKYLKHDFFVFDTAFTEESTSGKSSRSIYTVVRGNLLHSKIKKQIICQYDALPAFYHSSLTLIHNNYTSVYDKKKVKIINVWRNTLNDDVFLEEKRQIEAQKINAVAHLYFQVSIILLIVILIILKKKSEVAV